MKKIILTAIATLFVLTAFSQTPANNADKRQDMKDLRHDTRDIRHDKTQRHYDVTHHEYAAARHTTRDIHADKRDRYHDTKDLKRDGVKHPQLRADRQIHRQNVRRSEG
jgi:hypothetical protein